MAVTRTERLLNLVFVLTNAARPLLKARLRELVYADSASDEAFERMFERDKEELRNIGIPIETVATDVVADDELGYRLSKEWRLPEVEFTVAELSVLAVAAATWQDACLAPAALTALRKLEATGDAWAAPGLPVAPRVATGDPAFATILGAIHTKREVQFDYRKPQGARSSRRLHPYGLVQRHGLWYVVGHDLDRDGERVFRLSRIQDAPRVVGPAGAYSPPAELALERHAGTMAQESALLAARLRVRSGSALELRHRASAIEPGGEHDFLTLAFSDIAPFSASLAAYGDAVIVEAPESLRLAVQDRLRAAAGAA